MRCGYVLPTAQHLNHAHPTCRDGWSYPASPQACTNGGNQVMAINFGWNLPNIGYLNFAFLNKVGKRRKRGKLLLYVFTTVQCDTEYLTCVCWPLHIQNSMFVLLHVTLQVGLCGHNSPVSLSTGYAGYFTFKCIEC
jgi:hypothetical protein